MRFVFNRDEPQGQGRRAAIRCLLSVFNTSVLPRARQNTQFLSRNKEERLKKVCRFDFYLALEKHEIFVTNVSR